MGNSRRLLVIPALALAASCALPDVTVDEDAGLDGGTQDGASQSDDASVDARTPDGVADAADAHDASAACGAALGTLCAVGAVCGGDADCEGKCSAGRCAPPTVTDGKVSPSLGETDIDCGGAMAVKCAATRHCKTDDDCTTAVCSALTKTCTVAPSCRGANGVWGITTCGVGEPGTADCCASLPLPTRTTRRLDQYEITAGRLRAFVDALTTANGGNPNVRAWAIAYAAANPTSQLAEIATTYPGFLTVLPDHGGSGGVNSLSAHLGAVSLDNQQGCPGSGCSFNLDMCFIGPGQEGAATYWQPPSDLAPLGVGYPDVNGIPDGTRKYSREQLDLKPVNCLMPIMLAAFCAWDGGELARTRDYAEIVAASGLNYFTALAAPPNVGQMNWRNGLPTLFYEFPLPHVALDDNSPVIAAPGRFVKDLTPRHSANGAGWVDIGANLDEAAWPFGGDKPELRAPLASTNYCDTSVTPGPGDVTCTRTAGDIAVKTGVLRYAGAVPYVTTMNGLNPYLEWGDSPAAPIPNNYQPETALVGSVLRSATSQLARLGGRCVR